VATILVAAVAGRADAQVGSANVPLPNVMLLLDTSGSFEHMIDGSNPEDTTAGPYNASVTGNNNPVTNMYANCETAWNTAGGPYSALPNRWGVAVQALTGTVLDSAGNTFYSCVTMDRVDGVVAPSGTAPFSLSTATTNPNAAFATAVLGNGLDSQYGLINESKLYSIPYDSGYYLPFHRPVSKVVGTTPLGRCVYTPGVLPGAVNGGVGVVVGSGMPATGDCPNESSGVCLSSDFPNGNAVGHNAVGQYLYDSFPSTTGPHAIGSTQLGTPNLGYASGATSCTFNQAADGFIDQAQTLVRFGLMTFDNDPASNIGVYNSGSTTVPSLTPVGYTTVSPFLGQWSYFKGWTINPPSGFITGEPSGCNTPTVFELGARNPGAPPWEGRLIGFPAPDADVLATAYNNSLVQLAINSMRPYGATPTAALMTDAAYYFWGDPQGPAGTTAPSPDLFATGGCRAQYIILLTDGGPNQDLRPSCQGSGGLCPFHLPEETAAILASGVADTSTDVVATLPAPPANGNVYTYVIGFAVSGNNDQGLANCAELAATGQLATQCAATTTPSDTMPSPTSSTYSTLESPCCSLQRIAVAGRTQHAYFADTPGDLQAALAAVLGDIEGQLGSRTIPVASPSVSYAAGTPLTAMFFSTFQAATNCPTTGPCPLIGPWTGDVLREDFVCPGGAGGAAQTTTQYLTTDDFATDLAAQNQTTRNFLFFNAYASGGTVGTNGLTIRPYLNTSHVVGNSAGAAPTASDNLDTFHSNGQDGSEISNFGVGNVNGIYQALTQTCTATGCPALGTSTISCQDPATTNYTNPATCANLALSFAMAQSTFPIQGTSTPAASNLQNQYQSGNDGNNTGSPTNRSTAPMGAVLDSTPAVVGPPAAQVRDDSYQAFVTGLSTTTLAANPRHTMLYVATVDGLLHAFDTTVGLPQPTPFPTTPKTQVESWAFVPPAALPGLVKNYPGANNILVDGAPVVKDVVFSRTPGQTIPWVEEWHTMLVAGFGAGGRGYYALDVTDPRWPSSADTAATDSTFTGTSLYPTYVASPATASALTGPHFQWQITSANVTGNPLFATSVPTTELFGNVSGTPAIATVYADPTLPSSGAVSPQEIGVAILPGGRNGLPIPGMTCPRELAVNSGNYTTKATLWSTSGYATAAGVTGFSAYNLADSAFAPRYSVRGWASACTGHGSNVPGRSVMVVSIATGQVLAVFARAKSSAFLPADPTTWDVPTYGSQGTSVIDQSYLVATPLDSPMTGTPVVYPSGVGVVAQAFYLGDADGTMWRFDLSDPNPRNWTGAIFADAYSAKADLSGTDTMTPTSSSPDWPALDSEAISVPPVLALDNTATLTMDFATGDQTAFNPCYSVPGLNPKLASGITNPNCTPPLQPTVNFLYSVRETRGGSTPFPHAQVKWYQEWTTGERVTGPMAIFNGALYYATYLPPGVSGTVCSQGGPNLYANDFANPPKNPKCSKGALNDSGANIGCGGDPTIDSNFAPTGELTTSALGLTGANPNTIVIPGVAVTATPSCTQTSNIPSDAYTGGGHTAATNTTPGSYSLTANIGKKGTAASNVVTQKLQAPTAPTIVDSWATIAE
jgi:type IV pilus assembly protein PilY1